MELEILESKQGTKVVTASNLYQVLGLPAHHYSASARKWMKDLYEFSDGIRRPRPLRTRSVKPSTRTSSPHGSPSRWRA